jgi:SWI/SNF-related matrix-associated actin-dependent regulator of chromatin subfamily A member 5
MIWIEPAKRERKGNYSIDQYYRDNMKVGGSKPDKPKVPRPPKQVHINDFQFYPARLVELQNREYDAHRVSYCWLAVNQKLMNLESAELHCPRC